MFIQVDAAEAVRKELRGLLAGVKVRAELDDEWHVSDGLAVTVVSDGTPSRGLATSAETVRVTVYGKYLPEVRKLAAQIDAYLLDPTKMWGFTVVPSMGLLSAKDTALGAWCVSLNIVAQATKGGK